jgi:rSAM/selenodomain-associated transferase 1
MRAIVVIVAKEPVATKVKTRLCTGISPSRAAEIYTHFIQDMVGEMSGGAKAEAGLPGNVQPCFRLALAYSPEGAESVFETIMPIPIPTFPQQGEDLGERLANIFIKLFAEGYEQVHIINSDSPDMPCSLVVESTKLLESPQTDLVLGPCDDGGYYLIGLKKPTPELFQDIPWSTDRVLALTLERARTSGLSCALLKPWYDIDTCDDLVRFLDRNKTGKDACGPGWRTLKYLEDKQVAAHLHSRGLYGTIKDGTGKEYG